MKFSLSKPKKENECAYYTSNISFNDLNCFSLKGINTYFFENDRKEILVPFENIDYEGKTVLHDFVSHFAEQVEMQSQEWFGTVVTATRLREMTQFSHRTGKNELRISLDSVVKEISYDSKEFEEDYPQTRLFQKVGAKTPISALHFVCDEIHFYQNNAVINCICSHIEFDETVEMSFLLENERELENEENEKFISPLPDDLLHVREKASSELKRKKKDAKQLKIVQEYMRMEYEKKQNELLELENDIEVLSTELL